MRTFFAALLGVLLLFSVRAAAHPLLQDSMWVMFTPERVRVAVNVSLKEIAVAQALPAEADGSYDAEEMTAAAERHRPYVASHLHVGAEGRALAPKVTQLTPPPMVTSPEQTFFQYELDYPLDGTRPREVTLQHEMLREFSYAVGTPWEVTYVVRLKREDSPEVWTGLLRGELPTEFATGWTESAAPPAVDLGRTFRDYVQHGTMHILTGYDHLLFVGALVLGTLSFWEMAKVIAAFTLAHTVTLTLATLDIFRLPPRVVEPLIALSIVFVALENIFWPRRAGSRARLAVAFGFGLVHGLGFAGGLLEAMEGLPSVGLGMALFAFSLGVEIGHQAVVLPVFGLLAVGRWKLRESVARSAVRYGSALISLCGTYYFCVAIEQQFLHR